MPMMWQCTLSASSIPIEIEGSAYMSALPFAKTGQCVQVQMIALLMRLFWRQECLQPCLPGLLARFTSYLRCMALHLALKACTAWAKINGPGCRLGSPRCSAMQRY